MIEKFERKIKIIQLNLTKNKATILKKKWMGFIRILITATKTVQYTMSKGNFQTKGCHKMI